jgi:hypothetical protein
MSKKSGKRKVPTSKRTTSPMESKASSENEALVNPYSLMEAYQSARKKLQKMSPEGWERILETSKPKKNKPLAGTEVKTANEGTKAGCSSVTHPSAHLQTNQDKSNRQILNGCLHKTFDATNYAAEG